MLRRATLRLFAPMIVRHEVNSAKHLQLQKLLGEQLEKYRALNLQLMEMQKQIKITHDLKDEFELACEQLGTDEEQDYILLIEAADKSIRDLKKQIISSTKSKTLLLAEIQKSHTSLKNECSEPITKQESAIKGLTLKS